MHFPGNFKSLVHEALGGAVERAYEIIAPFEQQAHTDQFQGIRQNGSGDQLPGETLFQIALL